MSKLTYEFTNGYLPENQSSPNGDRVVNKKNLNYIFIPSKSPPLYHNLNSVSSNTYSSYDPKMSSNNSNVSSSNESSMLNNSYHSTNDEYVEPQHKPSPVYTPKNYYDHRYTSYMPPNEASISSKRPIKIQNLPTDKARLNETILRNKISDFKPSFNPLNKRHSVNIDSYPSTPRSNLSTPPVQDVRSSNEKLLSYEYLSNSNYDKILNNENFYSDKISEGSYSMLTGSINKDRKAKSINNVSGDYNFVAGNLEAVKGDSVAHTESPLYRKIMSKLSEIPDSMFTKASSISENSDKMGEPAVNSKNFQEKSVKQKINLSPKMCPNMTTNSGTSTDDPNMYFDPKVFNDDVAPGQKVSGPQTVPNSEKVASQAGDLIYTSVPFYSSSLPKKTSNPTYDINDYLYSDERSKINSDLNKVEDNKKVNHENWMRVMGKNEEKASVNGRGKENGHVNNKNGINAYIKLIDTSQNKQKNLSSLDDFKSSGPIKYKNLANSKKTEKFISPIILNQRPRKKKNIMANKKFILAFNFIISNTNYENSHALLQIKQRTACPILSLSLQNWFFE
ncbi:hypothetical protein BpHYR1_034282 [Brachionus plicatilis]|uniref:Uncharacterized protein n=1 Tax=Brachionus plicatilis TaxID=10195 RepID=A0A3M7RUQ0_BRAPC|nr:hypothetical protein BpHYR1_034282 [Brachionus plicatilis]